MQRYTSLSLVAVLVACGSKVDLGDANQHVSSKSNAPGGGSSEPGGAPGEAGGTHGGAGATSGSGGSPGAAGGASVTADAGSSAIVGTSKSCDPISLERGVFNPCGRTSEIAYSLDGKLLATATEDQPRGLHLWRLSDGQRLRDFAGTEGLDALGVAFSPDGKLLAVSGYGPIAALYDVASGNQVRQIPVNCTEYVSSVAFSGDGAFLATGGENGPVEVWRVDDGALVTSIPRRCSVANLHFSPKGSNLIVDGATSPGAPDGSRPSATIFDIPDGTEGLTVGPIANEESDAMWSPDGAWIASTGDGDPPGSGGVLQIWDATTGSLHQRLTGQPGWISNSVWVDQDRILTNDWNGVIKSWSRQSMDLFAASQEWRTPAQSLGLAVSPDKRTFVAGTGVAGAASGNDLPEGFVFLAL